MEQIYWVREVIIKLYKQGETFISPVFKFILGYFVFSTIGSIGLSMEVFDVLAKPSVYLPYILLMSLFFTILPINLSYMLIVLNIIIQFSSNLEIAAIIGAVLLMIVFFYGRIGGKEQIFILLTILGFHFKVPYIVPLIAGLYYGVASVIPITIGVFLWEFYPLTFSLMNVEHPKAASIVDLPESFGQVLALFLDAVKNDNNWIVTAFVFALVVVVVYAASKMDVDFSKEIAIAMGVAVNIISFIFIRLALRYEISLIGLIFVSVLSGAIMVVVKFFDIALNYQRAERVEFEDDDNYYFVRIVPKIIVSKKERSVQMIKDSPNEAESVHRRGSRSDIVRRENTLAKEPPEEYDDYIYSDDEYYDYEEYDDAGDYNDEDYDYEDDSRK